MADVTTIAASVLTTLGIQSIYYIVLDYPYQLHKDKAKQAEVTVRENANYHILRRAVSDFSLALRAFHKWQVHILTLASAAEPLDLSPLRDLILPEVVTQLGKLQATTQLDDATHYQPIVSDIVELCQSARRISKLIMASGFVSREIALEIEDLSLTQLTITTRLEQARSSDILRQARIRFEMANVEADVRNTTRRLRAAGVLISIVIFFFCYRLYDYVLSHLTIANFV